MNDNAKTREQLIQELETLRRQVATLQESESERRRAEAALRVSEDRLAIAMQGSNEGIWDWDIQNNSLYWSPLLKEWLGYTDDELEIRLGAFTTLLHPDDKARVDAALEAHLKDGAPYDVELRQLTKSGEYRWFHDRGTAIRDEGGQPIRMVGFSADITQHKEAEAERERLLADLARRAVQLQTAAEVSRAASSILDVDELLPQVVELIRARFKLYYAGLFLVQDPRQGMDETSQSLPLKGTQGAGVWAVLRAGTGEAGRRMLQVGHKLELSSASMVCSCITQGKPCVALDAQEATRFANPLLPETRSEMALPLVSRGRAIGAMTIQSTQPAAFTQEDTTVLQTMADQVATAIENAHLFMEGQRRITELASLTEIGQALSSALELNQVLETIYQQTGRIFDTTSFYIATYEEGSDVWKLALRQERGQRIPVGQYPLGLGLTSYILRSRQPLLFHTGQALQDFQTEHSLELIGDPAKSWMGVPLVASGKIVGVMAIQSYEQENLYDSQDLVIFSTLATQAAISIQNARLFEETRRRAQQLETINDIGRTITSTLDPDALLRQIVDTTKAHFDLYYASIYLVKDHALVLQEGTTVGSAGARPVRGLVKLDLDGPGLTTLAVRTDQPVLVNDVRSDPRYVFVPEMADTLSEVDVPIKVKDRVIGVLGMLSDRPSAFDQADVALLQSLANQAGVAIDNARLFEEARARAEELAALNEMSRALTSMLDAGREAVVESLYQYASRLIDTTNFFVALCAAEDEVSFPLVFEYGQRRQWAPRQARQGLTEHVIRTRQSLLIEENVSERMKELNIETIGDVALSWLGVPMMSGEKVIGVIAAQSYTTPRLYNERRRDLLNAVASQAAIAIENARLFEEARVRAEEMAVLNELSRALTGLFNVQEVLEEVYRGTARIIHADSFYVAMYDPEKDEVSFPFEIIEGVRVYSPSRRAGKGLSEYVVRTREPLLILENPVEWAAKHGCEFFDYIPLSWLGVPIMTGDRVLGAMVIVNRNNPRVYDEHHQSLLMSIASQAAVAIQNARLFEETKAALAEVETTHRRYLHEQWETFLTGAAERILGYADGPDGLIPAGDESLAVAPATGAGSLRVPIKLRDASIGVLEFRDKDTTRDWSEDELTLVEALADQAGLALENARLFEQTQRQAARERLINEITARIRASTGVPGILQTAARELATAMNVPHAVARIRIKTDEMENEDRTA